MKRIRKINLALVLVALTATPLQARDFEDNYAVYGAGAEPCSNYLQAMNRSGKELDYFIDWTVGYLSAFNVIMPATYNVLGETSFPEAQQWLMRHCRQYPNELFINATLKLTEVLYPGRYQSSLKNPPNPPKLKDVSKAATSGK